MYWELKTVLPDVFFGSHPQSNLNGSVGSLMEKLGNSFLNPEYEKILRERFLAG